MLVEEEGEGGELLGDLYPAKSGATRGDRKGLCPYLLQIFLENINRGNRDDGYSCLIHTY